MPKEVLSAAASVVDEFGLFDPEFALHWGTGDSVELSVLLDVEYIRSVLDEADTLRDDWDESGTIRVFSAQLPRFEVQRSIKALRRARDAVYGSDE